MINYEDVFSYLGYKNACADENTAKIIDEIAEKAKTVCPKSVYQIFPCEVFEDYTVIAGVKFKSRALTSHIKGCTKACLMAVTLGTAADNFAKAYAAVDSGKMMIAQAVLSVMAEQAAEDLSSEIKRIAQKEKMHTRARFSPGYSDLPLSAGKNICDILSADKRIGITFTDAYMMIPSKSITAVIGIGNAMCRENENKCRLCGKRDCEFRRKRG